MPNSPILIVDDEPEIRELLRLALTAAGYTTLYEAADGQAALRIARQRHPSLILLDLMLPGIDGLDVCRQLKSDDLTKMIPVIMLTAKSEESDIVLGLELGASDYITKPFSRKILIARIHAQLRDFSAEAAAEEITRGPLVLNTALHRVTLNGAPIDLTAGEFELLKLFVTQPGRVQTRRHIINLKDGSYAVTERAVDVQIVNLRRKLGSYGAEHIETIRGIGYRFISEQP